MSFNFVRSLLIIFGCCLASAPNAYADASTPLVVSSCGGTAIYSGLAGGTRVPTIDINGILCTTASTGSGGGSTTANQGTAGTSPWPVAAVYQTYVLLTNAAATGPAVAPSAGSYFYNLGGTFGGASVQLTQTVNGVTSNVGPALTAATSPTTPPLYTVGQGTTLQAVVSGATGTTSLTASLNSTGSAPPPVSTALPTTVVTGQSVIVTTGTAVQLAANALVNGIVVKAKGTNSTACGAVGASNVTNAYTGSGAGYGLCPGEAASFAVSNTSAIYINGSAGDIFTFEGN